jgi:hypothetical protein
VFEAVAAPDPMRGGAALLQYVVTGDDSDPATVTPGLYDEAMESERRATRGRPLYLAGVWAVFAGIVAWFLSAFDP